jgi:hypothetical protein
MRPVNLLTQRYEQLVVAYTKFYMTHPDAEVYSPEYREVLARCMAAEIAYGVSYEADVETSLKRLNKWRSITREESQRFSSD